MCLLLGVLVGRAVPWMQGWRTRAAHRAAEQKLDALYSQYDDIYHRWDE
ncbi:MAG: hypothetical protein AVDCRST_MAG93-4736 [uncultured Chloroflexia bacterium]|uniref:Uncharacterized protein n=1 Tax=uncultured Chloroflexia bacterium TaxID=1672391 RepID=A0A6J4KF29_9CHLR|nr:MAG: hypothetical protein AVDCRST_MAG93-4736 [uncultured Chloroflexia bacterium]